MTAEPAARTHFAPTGLAHLRKATPQFAGGTPARRKNMRNTTILLVDDDASVRDSVRRVLEDAGYDVMLAADGQEALDRFTAGRVDLLVLDIGLPIRNGWETFEEISKRDPALPIIIITGQSNQYDTALAAGVGALMEKPLDAPHLLMTLKDLLVEPEQNRLRRLCGYSHSTRHVPSASALFVRDLQERYAAPFRYSGPVRSPKRRGPEVP